MYRNTDTCVNYFKDAFGFLAGGKWKPSNFSFYATFTEKNLLTLEYKFKPFTKFPVISFCKLEYPKCANLSCHNCQT